MKTKDPIYKRFLTALSHEVKQNWHRQQSTLAMEAGISSGSLTDILKGSSKATYETRASLAKACGFEYENFLDYGKTLIEGKNNFGNTEGNNIPIGNVIKVYNNILEKTGIELNATGQEKLFNLIKQRLQGKAADATEKDLLDVISLTSLRNKG